MENEAKRDVAVLKAHVALNVRSVGASIEFYKKMLELEPSKVRDGYAKFDVQNPPLNLTLNEVAVETSGALSHMGLQVSSTGDVVAMRERWAEAGLFTYDEMQTNCCYALQDKTWVTDPDGNAWEAFVVLEDNLTETAACCVAQADAREAETGARAATAPEASEACATQTATSAGQTLASAGQTLTGVAQAVSGAVQGESGAAQGESAAACGCASTAPTKISNAVLATAASKASCCGDAQGG